MQISLNERFKTFISQLSLTEVIDDLDLPSDFDKKKRADFLIKNRKVIIELKSLESDPEYKIHDELKNHQKRDEYPLFYGELEIHKVLKHLPDGKKINEKIFYKIARSIENSFRKADKQIEATKEIFSCHDSFGLLILLNENIKVLSPEMIAHRVSQLLTKTDNDGQIHYRNITSVWFISENYSLKTKKGYRLLPSIVIDGPSADNKVEFSKIMDKLQSEWASFNKVPLVTTGMNKINDTDFISLPKLKEEPQDFIPRYELWRKQYRNSPYLRSLADEAVLIHGARLFNIMAPHFLKDGYKIPFNKMTQFMEGWTHFLEETSYRGLDLKKMPTRDFA